MRYVLQVGITRQPAVFLTGGMQLSCRCQMRCDTAVISSFFTLYANTHATHSLQCGQLTHARQAVTLPNFQCLLMMLHTIFDISNKEYTYAGESLVLRSQEPGGIVHDPFEGIDARR